MQTCYDRVKSCQLNVRMLSQSVNKQTRQVFHVRTQIYVVFWIMIPLMWSLVINILNTQPSVFMAEMNLEK